MKRALRFAFMLVVALVSVPFLPLYLERTMTRSWHVDRTADLVDWGWKICSLSTFWSEYNYFRPEQSPAFWLTVNLALAFIYALLFAGGIDQFLARRRRRREVAH
jgi:hypothetical protein